MPEGLRPLYVLGSEVVPIIGIDVLADRNSEFDKSGCGREQYVCE